MFPAEKTQQLPSLDTFLLKKPLVLSPAANISRNFANSPSSPIKIVQASFKIPKKRQNSRNLQQKVPITRTLVPFSWRG